MILDLLVPRGSHILVVDENLYLAKRGYVDTGYMNLWYVQREEEFKLNVGVDLALFVEPTNIPRTSRFENILVMISPSYGTRIPRYYARSILKKIYSSIYLLEFMDLMERYRLQISGMNVTLLENRPQGLPGLVLDVLRRSVFEFGELRIRDAVNIVSRELNLDRLVARRNIYRLAEWRFIEIRKGRVIVY